MTNFIPVTEHLLYLLSLPSLLLCLVLHHLQLIKIFFNKDMALTIMEALLATL